MHLAVWAIELILLNDVLHFDAVDELIQLIVSSFNEGRVLPFSPTIVLRYSAYRPALIVPFAHFSCGTRVFARSGNRFCLVFDWIPQLVTYVVIIYFASRHILRADVAFGLICVEVLFGRGCSSCSSLLASNARVSPLTGDRAQLNCQIDAQLPGIIWIRGHRDDYFAGLSGNLCGRVVGMLSPRERYWVQGEIPHHYKLRIIFIGRQRQSHHISCQASIPSLG